MPAYEPKTRDFFAQGDSEKALEIKNALEEVMANIATLQTWGTTLAAKLNADGGVTDTNYAAPSL